MNYLRSRLIAYFLRSFHKDLSTLAGKIDKKEQDTFLSSWYQNPAFRSYIKAREAAIVLYMANENTKPSDQLYTELYGRRLELLDIYNAAHLAYNKRQRELAKAQKDSESKQASA